MSEEREVGLQLSSSDAKALTFEGRDFSMWKKTIFNELRARDLEHTLTTPMPIEDGEAKEEAKKETKKLMKEHAKAWTFEGRPRIFGTRSDF